MAALVAQQALVLLVAWQHVDSAPEAGPAFEAAQLHVCGNQAGGGAHYHAEIAPKVFHVPGVPAVVQTHPIVPPAVGAEL